ncbi:hypothetical protein MTR67_041252 [Solanum verrucosum]|uniref:Uncharacterized protein n=1 Tax=Solanum verrucosum TaxID=315347 RepID=A0AAF0ZQ54_SOLVR|nr:hypothetical protein MTR67_041252 [Solanum verrucosum]
MESKEDEALPKRSKPMEIQSISSKDSVLSMPKLPAELITEIFPKFVICEDPFLLCASNKDYTHLGVMFKVVSYAGIGVTDCSLSALLHHSVKEVIDLDYPGKNPKDYPWLVGSVKD